MESVTPSVLAWGAHRVCLICLEWEARDKHLQRWSKTAKGKKYVSNGCTNIWLHISRVFGDLEKIVSLVDRYQVITSTYPDTHGPPLGCCFSKDHNAWRSWINHFSCLLDSLLPFILGSLSSSSHSKSNWKVTNCQAHCLLHKLAPKINSKPLETPLSQWKAVKKKKKLLMPLWRILSLRRQGKGYKRSNVYIESVLHHKNYLRPQGRERRGGKK